MRYFSLLLLGILTCHAGDTFPYPADPKVVLRIAEALEDSKNDELASGYCQWGTYRHLSEVHYLGELVRSGQRYTVAYAVYTLEPPTIEGDGEQIPPLRYDFILILDSKFHIVSYSHCGVVSLRMKDEQLISGDTVLVDFKIADATIRYGGFQIGKTNLHLPYPFADRITEAYWKAGELNNNGIGHHPALPKEAEQPADGKPPQAHQSPH